jgi:hypothetical protein
MASGNLHKWEREAIYNWADILIHLVSKLLLYLDGMENIFKNSRAIIEFKEKASVALVQ